MHAVTPRAPAPLPHRAVRGNTGGRAASFALNASVLATLLAASSAPTPLYPHYQDAWGLSALTITVVFSAYALALLLALLTTGSLSDHLGRRPVLAGALALGAVSMLLLATADGAGDLITARILQGAATGAATSAAGAALLDLEDPLRPGRSALTNSIAPVAGMAVGVLLSTLLAPAGAVGVYLVPAVLFAAQAVAVSFTTETAHPHAGALRSLRPRLAVAPQARRALLVAGTAVVAIWALGGFYSSLGPSLVHLVAPAAPQSAGGMVFFTLTAAATLTVWTLRRTRPRIAVTGGSLAVLPAGALALGGLHGAGLPAVYGGAALAGIAFGAVSQGALRMTLTGLPEHERAATLATYYVLSYLSMSLPAIAAGAATRRYGLATATHAYAVATALLAAAALGALAAARHRDLRGAPDVLP
ncbi:MFS transporter [Streptomyces sp. NPDC002120]|uniref:MFS transporter n=1 Tax=Streptomyces sp. NPDC002120 TaxID=3364631 RepID=UPI0036CE7B2B